MVHEAGHALACLALGSKIRAVYLGNAAPGRRRFTVGKVVVAPGLIAGGRVEHEGARSAGRNALIAAAGALADVIAAGALLAVFRPGNGLIAGLALVMAGLGVASLLPYRLRSGRPTDGARLLAFVAGGVFAEAVRSRDKNSWLLVRDAPRKLRAEYDEIKTGRQTNTAAEPSLRRPPPSPRRHQPPQLTCALGCPTQVSVRIAVICDRFSSCLAARRDVGR